MSYSHESYIPTQSRYPSYSRSHSHRQDSVDSLYDPAYPDIALPAAASARPHSPSASPPSNRRRASSVKSTFSTRSLRSTRSVPDLSDAEAEQWTRSIRGINHSGHSEGGAGGDELSPKSVSAVSFRRDTITGSAIDSDGTFGAPGTGRAGQQYPSISVTSEVGTSGGTTTMSPRPNASSPARGVGSGSPSRPQPQSQHATTSSQAPQTQYHRSSPLHEESGEDEEEEDDAHMPTFTAPTGASSSPARPARNGLRASMAGVSASGIGGPGSDRPTVRTANSDSPLMHDISGANTPVMQHDERDPFEERITFGAFRRPSEVPSYEASTAEPTPDLHSQPVVASAPTIHINSLPNSPVPLNGTSTFSPPAAYRPTIQTPTRTASLGQGQGPFHDTNRSPDQKRPLPRSETLGHAPSYLHGGSASIDFSASPVPPAAAGIPTSAHPAMYGRTSLTTIDSGYTGHTGVTGATGVSGTTSAYDATSFKSGSAAERRSQRMARQAAKKAGKKDWRQPGAQQVKRQPFQSTRLKGEIYKPWLEKRDPAQRWAKAITLFSIFVGFVIMGVLCWDGYNSVPKLGNICPVLNEDFSSGINPDVWTQEVRLDGYSHGQFDWSTASPNNSFVDGKTLYLVPTLTSDIIGDAAIQNGYTLNLTADGTCTSTNVSQCVAVSNSSLLTVINPVRSARLTTRKSVSIKYGKVEVVARFPTGDWLWPSILMQPVNNTYGNAPRSGVIDILTGRGNNASYPQRGVDFAQSSLHWGPTPELDRSWMTWGYREQRRTAYNQAFHTYGLEWNQDYMWTYIDSRVDQVISLRFNQNFWSRGSFPSTITNSTTGDIVRLINPWINSENNNAPFDQPFYLTLSLGVGATDGWFPDGEGGKPWLDGSLSAMSDFWNAKNKWWNNWPSDPKTRGFAIQSVKMWRTC